MNDNIKSSATDHQNYFYYKKSQRFTEHQTAIEGRFNIIVGYRINKRISILIEPVYELSIVGLKDSYVYTDPITGNPLRLNYRYDPNYYSLNLGLLYKFKKK